MTGSQNCSSYPVSNTCPVGQASASLLCSEDNTDILSFDKLFHCYYHCCKSLAYRNYGESCRCYLISDLYVYSSTLQGQRSSGVTQVHDQQVTPIPFTALGVRMGEWGLQYSPAF